MTAGKRGPAELVSQRSYDAGGSRPHKFFKLDRTYSDVVEDELYNSAEMPPSSGEATVKDATQGAGAPIARHPKSAPIQSAYPQLFETESRKSDTESPSISPNVDFRSNNYFTGMESSVRFEAKASRGGQGGKMPIMADKMKKVNAQPMNVPTVSPKEAFLDNTNMLPPMQTAIASSSSESLLSTPSAEQSVAVKLDPGLAHLRQATPDLKPIAPVAEQYNIHAEPSSIIPVRQNGHEAPRPVQTLYGAYSPYGGPMDANARFRTLSKEESSVSNISSLSSGYGDSESEPSASQQQQQQQHQMQQMRQQMAQQPYALPEPPPEYFSCEECGRSFEKQTSLTAHKRVHNKTSASRSPVGVAGSADEGDDFIPPPAEDGEGSQTAGGFNKNGPHRCDWINPSTGLRCGTIFSRPYDLVRHQDTIHGKKRKEFRCEICRAIDVEKVFSRNDALVRHMRHVHNQELKKV